MVDWLLGAGRSISCFVLACTKVCNRFWCLKQRIGLFISRYYLQLLLTVNGYLSLVSSSLSVPLRSLLCYSERNWKKWEWMTVSDTGRFKAEKAIWGLRQKWRVKAIVCQNFEGFRPGSCAPNQMLHVASKICRELAEGLHLFFLKNKNKTCIAIASKINVHSHQECCCWWSHTWRQIKLPDSS